MAKHILKCPKCGKYTMKDKCSDCDVITVQVKPPKFSPEDPYGEYRRKARTEDLEKKDLI
ncbi:MAG: RNA-protein complex protein Nop10 [Nanoarchaeota archaeon]|nr:RNA-protein complex protein Nop10 [Nanoarchaeota archaeon]